MSEDPTENNQTFGLDEDAKRRGVIEALIIASDEALTLGRLVELVGNGVGAGDVRRHIDELNTEYVQTGRSFRIVEVAGGYQMSVHTEFAPWIRQLLQEKPVRLSQAALETLSIVAFKQPITKAEVEHIRGVASDGVLRHLLEKGLARIAGRSDGVGRPLLYGTARDFLRFFGLKTLAELPEIKEIEDLLKEEESDRMPDRHPPEIDETGSESEEAGEQDVEGAPRAGLSEDEATGEDDLAVRKVGVGTSEQNDRNHLDGETTAGATEPILGTNGHRIEEDV
jgi:segregation and condensation protein B